MRIFSLAATDGSESLRSPWMVIFRMILGVGRSWAGAGWGRAARMMSERAQGRPRCMGSHSYETKRGVSTKGASPGRRIEEEPYRKLTIRRWGGDGDERPAAGVP